MKSTLGPGAIVGRCRIQGRIGTGSMGTVYLAHHNTLDLPVAVKILNQMPPGFEHGDWRERLRREARIAARLNHPGLVRVLDYGEEDDVPYLVMEYVHGDTLEGFLAQRGLVDEHVALRILGQVATALHAAHQEGVVHRDLKPANILVGPGGILKIADLGLARDPHAAPITHASGIMGTPHYMAPEALDQSAATDHRVDLYALGVMFYRMVFGRLPFRGTLHQVLAGHIQGQPDWELPDGIRLSNGSLYVLRRLMEKWPARRLQSALEVVQACREQLGRLDGQRRMEEARAARDAEASTGSSGSRLAKALRLRLQSSSRPKGGIHVVHATTRERVVALVFLALLGLAIVQGCRERAERRRPPETLSTPVEVQTGR